MCFGCICGKKKTGKATDRQFTKECLAALNSCRSVHGVSSLSYNRDIERVAQDWADHLARTNGFSHNPKATYKGENLGENIASRWTSNREDYPGPQPVEQWYKEIERYDFKTYSGPKTGHFTQVVWKGSKEVGIGRAQSSDGTWIVVANFYPPGNYVGQHESNVFPAKKGKTPKFLTAKATGRTEAASSSAPAARGGTEHVTSSASKTTTRRQVRTEKIGNVTKTITTETTTESNGTTTEKVTEKVETPGSKTQTKVTETVTKPDGKKTTKTTSS
jgi:glioma pathogenesis-related protein 2